MSSKLQFEIYVTTGEKQQTIIVEDKPILFGCGKNCHVQMGSSEPNLKALIQRADDQLLVKVFDTKFPVQINNKKYKSAKIKKSTFFKLGPIDIVLNIEEVKAEVLEEVFDDSEGELTDFVDDGGKFDKTEPTITTTKTTTEIKNFDELYHENEMVVDEKVKQSRTVPVGMISQNGFAFNIKFDNTGFYRMKLAPYKDKSWDFSNYIDLEDETVKKIPSTEIVKEQKGFAIHITHTNNGTVIGDKYYPTKQKRVFLSNVNDGGNFFKVSDSGVKKEELVFIRDKKVSVVGLTGYSMVKVSNEKAIEVNSSTAILMPKESIILSRGTSQIIVRIDKLPPTIKTADIFDIEHKLVKSVAGMVMAFCLPLILIAMLIDTKKEVKKPKSEIVTIYKRKKAPKAEKKPAAPSAQAAKSENSKPVQQPKKQEPKQSNKVAKKTPVKKTKPIKKKIVKVNPKKTVNKKITRKTPKKVSKLVTKKVTKAAKTPPAKPQKTYKFNFSNKMNSLVGKTNNSKLKTAKRTANIDAASSISSSSSLTRNYDSSSFGKAKNKVARFAAGSVSGSSKAVGTRGLSGKTRSTTAYMEANTKILGAIDPELIRKIMRERIPDFRTCYQWELNRNPSVAGVFDLIFQINSRGKGVRVKVRSNGKGFSRKGISCIKNVVKLMKFPRPKGGGFVDVKQPMNFFQN